MEAKYKRVLLKLSGEALAGKNGNCIEPESLASIAEEIADAHSLGTEIAVVVGGGNIYRGKLAAEYGFERCAADNIGMLATAINCLALHATLENQGIEARVMTAIQMLKVADYFIRNKALRHLEKGRVVILACGTGHPYFTTDSAAALRALELNADVFLKATDVDGIYSADPSEYGAAKRYNTLSYEDYLLSGLSVMDWTAVSLCRANKLPAVVFNLLDKGNIRRVLVGENIGTSLRESEDA